MPLNFLNTGYFADKVGIGTNSPGAKLEIKDGDIWLNGATSSSNPEIRFLDDSPTIAGAKIRYGNTDGNLYIEHMWDTSTSGIFFRNRTTGTTLNTMALVNGNVGIGTTAPNYVLDISKDNTSILNLHRPNSSTAAASFLDFSFNTANATEAVYARIRSDVEVNTDSAQGGDLSFHTANAGTVGEVMRLTQEGNVGIGTSNPTSQLSIGSNAITTKKPTVIIADGVAGGSLVIRGLSPILSFDRTGASPENKILMDDAGLEFKTGSLDAEGDVDFKIKLDGKLQAPAYTQGFLQSDANGNIEISGGGTLPGGPYLPLSAGSSYPLTGELHVDDRVIIENTTNLTTGVVDSLLIKTLSSGTSITNGFGTAIAFYLENTVYSAVNEVGKISIIQTDTTAIDNKMVFSVKDNNILADRLTLTGQEAVFTGNVGIGITTPQAPLSFANVAGNKIDFYYNTSANDRYGIQVQTSELRIHSGAAGDSTGGITFGKDDGTTFTEAMRVGNDGNVGIGTAPNQYAGYTTLTLGRAADNGSLLDFEYQNTRTFSVYANVNGGNINVITAKPLIFATSGTEQMRIDSSGNIGIATLSDIEAWDSNWGAIEFPRSAILFSKSSGNLHTLSNAYYDGAWKYKATAAATKISQSTSGVISLSVAPSGTLNTGVTWDTALFVDNDANVGIGTASPLGKLQVNEYTVASQGNQGVHGEVSVFADNGDESLFLGLKDSAYPNRGWAMNPVAFGVNSSLQFKEHGSTGVRMVIESGGNVGIGVTDPTEKLHLQSTTSGCFVRFADNTASGVYVGARADELEIYTGNAEQFGIDANGVVRFNAYGTGILQTDTNGVISANLSPLVDDIIFNNGASITNQINTDIDSAAAEMVAQVAIATYTAAFFDFVIKKTTNVRSGTVYACHDGTNVEFTETSTQDLGDTSDVTLSVDISGGNMRLLATVTSDDWSIKSLIRAI